jgi:hypothetical protein
MNIIFVTMGAIYTPYFEVYKNLEADIDNIGFYTSDKFHFEKNIKKDSKVKYLKEWELTEQLANIKIDKKLIEKFEKKYFSNESIWNAMSNDRRIFQGKYTKYTQNYKSNYNYDEMLRLFQVFTLNIESFIEDIRPDIVIGMGQGTIGDYLFYKIAKAKKIKFFALKSVKNGNYQTLTDSIGEEHKAIRESFDEYLGGKQVETEVQLEVNKYMQIIGKGVAPYEGNVAIPRKNKIFKKNDLVNYAKYIVKDVIFAFKKRDHHNQALFSLMYFYNNTYKFYRTSQLRKITKGRTIYELDKIKNGHYIFFPLHAEPEISLTNYAKFYQNQIEVIRNIGLQLPSKFKLIVKEHPRNIGRRSSGYYKKILEIPNVDFVDFELPSVEVLKRSKLVIVLSGNIGYEAVLSKIPVITLGATMYNMLPKTMVNHLDGIKDIYTEIDSTIENYRWSGDIFEKYICAIIKNSFPLDLYTVLLRKEGREGGGEFNKKGYKDNIDILTENIYKKITNRN